MNPSNLQNYGTIYARGKMDDKIKSFLNNKIKDGVFTGASVLFGKPFEPLVRVYEGSLSNDIPLAINEYTLFDLQSITKAIGTGLLCIYLEQEGLLNLDQGIETYLPIYAPKNLNKKNITFRHLLTHSSGLSDIDLEGEHKTTYDFWHTIFSAPLHFEPGTAIEYSDLGYRVLGKLIELKFNQSLETLTNNLLFSKLDKNKISYNPIDSFNIAGCPDAHGIIDDIQVRTLGGTLGCDGLFANAGSIFSLLSIMTTKNKILEEKLGSILAKNSFPSTANLNSHFDVLSSGSKTLGWEVNTKKYNYSGNFHNPTCFEKAGGAGTFIWFDQKSEYIFIYLTNHGKPKPFDESSWNKLVADVGPNSLSDIIYETI